MNVSETEYHELYVYAMGREGFPLQYVADAFAAQTADENTKPIRVVFSLIGLYLRVEKGYGGKQIQQVHMELARHKKLLPQVVLPKDRGFMTAGDVLAAPPGAERDRAIDAWCRCVWEAFGESHATIAGMLKNQG